MHRNTDNERTVWEMDFVRDGGEGNAVSHRQGTDLFALICLLSFNGCYYIIQSHIKLS